MSHRFVMFVNSPGFEDDRQAPEGSLQSIAELMGEGWTIAGSVPLWGGSLVYLERMPVSFPG